jgi:predicted phage terminase large subunit-like protein
MTGVDSFRQKCKSDLLTFTQVMFEARKGTSMKLNWHQQAMCEALEQVALGKITRLIINVPPRSGKTEIAVVNFIAWCMGNWPDSEFIHASYSKRLATNNTFHARSVMQHEVYSAIFGTADFRDDSNAKDEFRTGQGGIVYATGAEGTITGYGAGKMRSTFGGAIIIDDPHKAGEGNSKTRRENVIDWFLTTMESRKNDTNTPIIVIMQRLHDQDLSGFLLNGGNGEKWHHISIPAINDKGESFWPEQFPTSDLCRLESTDSYRFAGQYMQRPIVLGGNIIKGDWFHIHTQPPIIKQRLIYADTAQKTAERNDYSVFEYWGTGEDGRIYLLDLIRGKWEAPELERRAIAFWQKHKAADAARYGQLRQMKIEDKASGTGLIQAIKTKAQVPVAGIQRTKDKYTRLLDVVGYIEAGQVSLPQDAPFVSDFINECESFSADDTHSHDDQVDPMIDAINDLLASNNTATLWERML